MAAGACALMSVIAGGVVGVTALTHHRSGPRFVTAGVTPATSAPAALGGTGHFGTGPAGAGGGRSRTAAEADRTATRNPTPGAAPAPPAQGPAQPPAPQVITTRTETETREIPYPTRTVRDPSLPGGFRQVQGPGVAGEQTLRYLVTLTGGRPTARRLLDSTVTRPPEPQIVVVGDQADDQQSGGWPGPGSWPGDPGWGGRRGHCGTRLDLCLPLRRPAA